MNENGNGGGKAGEKGKRGWKEFFSLGEVGGYFFRKKDPSRPSNINLRMMHGVNKISIAIFLLGVLYLVYKLVIKPSLQ
ncbi:MAG TPA: DUF6728 family protein [Sphingobacteriaceae bacterium]|jgi:hypothetical protein